MAFPPDGLGESPPEPFSPTYAVPIRRRFQHSWSRHVLLFLLALATTTLAGALHYHAFVSDFGSREAGFALRDGLWYSLTILFILGAHEMGHYLACRRYQVDATLPYFLPFLIPFSWSLFQTGTLGAVIRIREPFPTRTVLFDIGVAGPIAGFVVLVPALFLGLSLSEVLPLPTQGSGLSLGEPLLFQWATALMFGSVPEGQGLNAHPMVFAAWFGMLATALNLLPFGQLDGGHITYATLGRLSTPISVATVAAAVIMTFVSPSWLFMTVMMLVMLLVLGPRHPRVLYEYEPLGPGRRAIAVFALLILIVCFTPVPIEPYDLIRQP
ncbi:MAG TPA: site-2 protease family protein [Vicinamibacterales bacterium]|nr:site-2 protease family protein [Vicinamibacterales bacterium]